jgi:hypothetical protein
MQRAIQHTDSRSIASEYIVICCTVASQFKSRMFVDKIEINKYKNPRYSADMGELQNTTFDDQD